MHYGVADLKKAAAVPFAGVAGYSPRLFLLLRSLFRRKENDGAYSETWQALSARSDLPAAHAFRIKNSRKMAEHWDSRDLSDKAVSHRVCFVTRCAS